MKKILVTGAGGLVGNEVFNKISQDNENIVYASWNRTPIGNEPRSIQIDLEQNSINNLNMNFDIVIHCAAAIPSVNNEDQWVGEVNRRMDDNIIHYCKDRKCVLIYISSTGLYGLSNRGWITESTKLDLQSNYSIQKRVSEEKIIDGCKDYFILRISSPYGIRMRQNNVLNRFINEAKRGNDLIYYGKGSRTQNFTCVSDIASACQSCLNSKENGIYNIASAEAVSMKNLAMLIVKHSNHIFKQKIYAKSNGNDDLQEEVRNNIDISLAKKKLRWKPEVNIEEGVQELLSAYTNMENN